MNAEAIRQLFEYHFSENHRLIEEYAPQLTQSQLSQPVDYSHGSVRDQLLHIMRVDEAWFSDLRGEVLPKPEDDQDFLDLERLGAEWGRIERMMREYLQNLRDEQLMDQPLQGEDKDLRVWQVLVQVVNHGTDHRAQVLRILHDLGVDTHYQDFIFFVYEHPS